MWCSSRRRGTGPGGLGRGGHGLGSATRPCSRLACDMCIKNTVHKFLECSAIGCCSCGMLSGAVGASMRSSAVTVAKGGMYQSDHGIYHALYHETKGGIYQCICHGIYQDIYHGIYLCMEDGIYHGIYHLRYIPWYIPRYITWYERWYIPYIWWYIPSYISEYITWYIPSQYFAYTMIYTMVYT